MPFSGPVLSTMSINIEGYSQAKADIVSTFAHGYDMGCMQETHTEHCRPCIHGMKLIAETRHRKYGSAVYAKPTLNISSTHWSDRFTDWSDNCEPGKDNDNISLQASSKRVWMAISTRKMQTTAPSWNRWLQLAQYCMGLLAEWLQWRPRGSI